MDLEQSSFLNETLFHIGKLEVQRYLAAVCSRRIESPEEGTIDSHVKVIENRAADNQSEMWVYFWEVQSAGIAQ